MTARQKQFNPENASLLTESIPDPFYNPLLNPWQAVVDIAAKHEDKILSRRDNYRRELEELGNPEDIPEGLGKWAELKDVYKYTKNYFLLSRTLGKTTIASLMGLTIYENGIGNDMMTPIITSMVIDKANGIGGIALTATVAGGFTAAEQLASGFLARKVVDEYPDVSKRLFAHLNSGDKESDELRHKPFKEIPPVRKLTYSFFLGSSFNVLREAIAVGEMDDDKLRKVSKLSTFITSSTVALLAAGVDTLNQGFADNETIQTGLDWTLKSPFFWVGVMVAYFGGDYLYSRHKRNKFIVNENPIPID
jgi:hypothetical protein